MGNRAVITTKDKRIGIYLHWNGGRDSVEAFLKYCELRGFRCPENDSYGWARMCQVIGNFFDQDGSGDGLSIGIDTLDRLDCDNWDNGVYIIEKWQIVGREFFKGREQMHYDLKKMLHVINDCQPYKDRLNPKVIDEL